MKIRQCIKLWWGRIWYGQPFEKGYFYKKIVAPSDKVLEMLHGYLRLEGEWERFSDVDTDWWGNWICWYRKKKPAVGNSIIDKFPFVEGEYSLDEKRLRSYLKKLDKIDSVN